MQVVLLIDLLGLQNAFLALSVRFDVVATRERVVADVSVRVVISVNVETTEVAIQRDFDEAQVCVDDGQCEDAPTCVLSRKRSCGDR